MHRMRKCALWSDCLFGYDWICMRTGVVGFTFLLLWPVGQRSWPKIVQRLLDKLDWIFFTFQGLRELRTQFLCNSKGVHVFDNIRTFHATIPCKSIQHIQ